MKEYDSIHKTIKKIDDKIQYLEDGYSKLKELLEKIIVKITQIDHDIKEQMENEVMISVVKDHQLDNDVDLLFDKVMSIKENRKLFKDLEEELNKIKDEVMFNTVGFS